MIVAADILYGEYSNMHEFVDTLNALANQRTDIYIAQQNRYPRSENKFRKLLSINFYVSQINIDDLIQDSSIFIYRLQKK